MTSVSANSVLLAYQTFGRFGKQRVDACLNYVVDAIIPGTNTREGTRDRIREIRDELHLQERYLESTFCHNLLSVAESDLAKGEYLDMRWLIPNVLAITQWSPPEYGTEYLKRRLGSLFERRQKPR